jgi:hypothetical protein
MDESHSTSSPLCMPPRTPSAFAMPNKTLSIK